MLNFSNQDKCIIHFDRALKTLFGGLTATEANPSCKIEQPKLTPQDQRISAALMRVNHTGEICAQALYQAQSIATNNYELSTKLKQAADEEVNHLIWTQERITQLGGHTSYLGPIWYIGSLTLGYIAAICGDNWSLGFIAETEYQVIQHLEAYMQKLRGNDYASRTIMQAMRDDEMQHAEEAISDGATELPAFIKSGMKSLADIMKAIAFKI